MNLIYKFAGPLAPGVSDPGHEPINQKINHSINSWFLVLGLWCLGLGSYCFFDSRGVSQATFLGSIGAGRPSNFVLKSLLFLIPFCFDFGSILGAKITPKIQENPSKINFESALQLRSLCDPIFIDFSFDFQPPGEAKI